MCFVFILKVENIIFFLINNVPLALLLPKIGHQQVSESQHCSNRKKKILRPPVFFIRTFVEGPHLFGGLIAIRLTIFSAY